MLKFSIPGFYNYFEAVKSFIIYKVEHPEQFYSDRIIDSSYDNCKPILWNGGRRPPTLFNVNIQQIHEFFRDFPEIKLRHVFTNCLLNEELTKDYICNKFVVDCVRPQDEVIINHPALIEHFKKEYPNIPIIYSTTLNIIDINQINEITENNIYVLNYNYNNDDNYLAQLKNKQNIEIICAEPCKPNCPNRMQHYTSISRGYLYEQPTQEDIDTCPYGSDKLLFCQLMTNPTAITNSRLKELETQGFQYFKISGRTVPLPQWLETMIYYFVLPKYHDVVRQTLLNQWW